MADKRGPWIQTAFGRRFYVLDPQPEDVDIFDVASALSKMCRFNGHTKSFYSIAQHCLAVSQACQDFPLWGLLHDASEAYIADICSPLKHSGVLNNYLQIESRIQKAVCSAFGLPLDEPDEVKKVDKWVLVAEAKAFMSPLDPQWAEFIVAQDSPLVAGKPMGPDEVFGRYIKRFFDLRDMRSK